MENYKEKYEHALDNFKKIKAANKDNNELVDFIEYEYPELKESEDERIRREMISFFTIENWHGAAPFSAETAKERVAWLERQGKNTPYEKVQPVSEILGRVYEAEKQLEQPEQGEQKPADLFVPKFKVGDWIVYCNEDVDLITGIEETGYLINKGGYIPFICQVDMRLWTIKDAKDGDVLASSRSIFIFQTEYIADKPTAYCGLMNNLFIKDSDGCWTNEKCYPATKEQRDFLFQKMKEARYEWDAEKKELKKIEQEEDAELTDFESALFSAFSDAWQEYLSGKEVNVAKWTREHSAELLEVAREQKPTWNERDENEYNHTLKILKLVAVEQETNGYNNLIGSINWLKSLKEKMKGE